MFTGIIEGMGTLTAMQTVAHSLRLTVKADFELMGTRIGDSIAVNGACLTAVRIEDSNFVADVSPETVAKTTFGTARVGQRVNLERALRLSDRLDGHLVSGHVDGTGRLTDRQPIANAIVLSFSAPPELTYYMIRKGSVAVDGISLTINQCDEKGFTVSIIPHTAARTTIGIKGVGDQFNLETDLIGKYVERFVTGRQPTRPAESGGIDMGLLAKSGFLDR